MARPYRELLNYDARTGVIRWRIKRCNRALAGALAGHKNPNDGYRRICINGLTCMAHRVAWEIHYGKAIPSGVQIDHINGERADNRISNLRLCLQSGNSRNRRPNNGRRFKGITRSKTAGKWLAKIWLEGGPFYLGTFNREIEAAKAYDAAARKHYGDFARLNFPETSHKV